MLLQIPVTGLLPMADRVEHILHIFWVVTPVTRFGGTPTYFTQKI
jgi:hypothetical protein